MCIINAILSLPTLLNHRVKSTSEMNLLVKLHRTSFVNGISFAHAKNQKNSVVSLEYHEQMAFGSCNA